MQLYVADYLGDTQHLTAEEHGAYLLLLMAMWRAGGTLPIDPHKLCRISRVHPPRWARIWATIRKFFTEDETGISQKRLTCELDHAKSVSSARSKAGKEGARVHHERQSWSTESSIKTGTYDDTKTEPKPLNRNDATVANAKQLLWHTQISDSDSEKKENKKDPPYPPLGGDAREAILEADAGGRAKDKVAGNGAIIPAEMITDAAMLVGADFEEFWSAYPEKTAKPKARAAYFRVRRGYRPKQGPPKSPVDHWVIMAGLRTYLGWVARAPADDKPPLLHPTTFLNGERWNDIRQERTGRQTIGNATVAAGRRLYERMTANNGADHDQQEPDDDRPERQAQLPSPRNYQ